MASRLDLSGDFEGLTYIYNVDGHVGPFRKNQNFPDDIELVQFLIRSMITRGGVGTTVFNTMPALTRQMDIVTAYWIVRYQDAHPDIQTVDGIVSPAHGAIYSWPKAWTIVCLNMRYNDLFGPEAFAMIPTNPELSASLRQSLQRL